MIVLLSLTRSDQNHGDSREMGSGRSSGKGDITKDFLASKRLGEEKVWVDLQWCQLHCLGQGLKDIEIMS